MGYTVAHFPFMVTGNHSNDGWLGNTPRDGAVGSWGKLGGYEGPLLLWRRGPCLKEVRHTEERGITQPHKNTVKRVIYMFEKKFDIVIHMSDSKKTLFLYLVL